MAEEALYGRRAELYDRIYHWKDYAVEAEKLHALLDAEGVPDGGRILEAACGTGNYLVPLSRWYDVAGFDLSAEMVRLARAKLPEAELFEADMADFAVDEPRDAVVCLFSSIGYLLTEDRLRQAAACFARAVRRGGLLVIEPWLEKEKWKEGHVGMHVVDDADLTACRMFSSELVDDVSHVFMNWMVVRPHERVEHFVEEHLLWMCPRSLMLAVLDEAGFDVAHREDGLMPERGLFVGRRRA